MDEVESVRVFRLRTRTAASVDGEIRMCSPALVTVLRDTDYTLYVVPDIPFGGGRWAFPHFLLRYTAC
jgi:hypothetical protein